MADQTQNPFAKFSPEQQEGIRQQFQKLFQSGSLNPAQAASVHTALGHLGGLNTNELAANALAQSGIPAPVASSGAPALPRDSWTDQEMAQSKAEGEAALNYALRDHPFKTALDVAIDQTPLQYSGIEGYPKIASGVKNLAIAPDRKARFKAGTETIQGGLEAATPLLAAGVATAPLKTALTIGTATATGMAVDKGFEWAGASPEASEFAGTVASLVPLSVGGHEVAKGQFGEVLTERPTGLPENPKPAPPTTNAVAKPVEPTPVAKVATPKPTAVAPKAKASAPGEPVTDAELAQLQRQQDVAIRTGDTAAADALAGIIDHELAKRTKPTPKAVSPKKEAVPPPATTSPAPVESAPVQAIPEKKFETPLEFANRGVDQAEQQYRNAKTDQERRDASAKIGSADVDRLLASGDPSSRAVSEAGEPATDYELANLHKQQDQAIRSGDTAAADALAGIIDHEMAKRGSAQVVNNKSDITKKGTYVSNAQDANVPSKLPEAKPRTEIAPSGSAQGQGSTPREQMALSKEAIAHRDDYSNAITELEAVRNSIKRAETADVTGKARFSATPERKAFLGREFTRLSAKAVTSLRNYVKSVHPDDADALFKELKNRLANVTDQKAKLDSLVDTDRAAKEIRKNLVNLPREARAATHRVLGDTIDESKPYVQRIKVAKTPDLRRRVEAAHAEIAKNIPNLRLAGEHQIADKYQEILDNKTPVIINYPRVRANLYNTALPEINLRNLRGLTGKPNLRSKNPTLPDDARIENKQLSQVDPEAGRFEREEQSRGYVQKAADELAEKSLHIKSQADIVDKASGGAQKRINSKLMGDLVNKHVKLSEAPLDDLKSLVRDTPALREHFKFNQLEQVRKTLGAEIAKRERAAAVPMQINLAKVRTALTTKGALPPADQAALPPARYFDEDLYQYPELAKKLNELDMDIVRTPPSKLRTALPGLARLVSKGGKRANEALAKMNAYQRRLAELGQSTLPEETLLEKQARKITHQAEEAPIGPQRGDSVEVQLGTGNKIRGTVESVDNGKVKFVSPEGRKYVQPLDKVKVVGQSKTIEAAPLDAVDFPKAKVVEVKPEEAQKTEKLTKAEDIAHGTSADKVESILRNGLQPGSAYEHSFFGDKITASDFATRASVGGKDAAIVYIKSEYASKLDKVKDPMSDFPIYHAKETVPPAAIDRIEIFKTDKLGALQQHVRTVRPEVVSSHGASMPDVERRSAQRSDTSRLVLNKLNSELRAEKEPAVRAELQRAIAREQVQGAPEPPKSPVMSKLAQIANMEGHEEVGPKFVEWVKMRTDLDKASRIELMGKMADAYLAEPGSKGFSAAYKLSREGAPKSTWRAEGDQSPILSPVVVAGDKWNALDTKGRRSWLDSIYNEGLDKDWASAQNYNDLPVEIRKDLGADVKPKPQLIRADKQAGIEAAAKSGYDPEKIARDVMAGGGEFIGIQDNTHFGAELLKQTGLPDYEVLLNDPDSKTTLNIPIEKLTPQHVSDRLAQKKAQFAAHDAKPTAETPVPELREPLVDSKQEAITKYKNILDNPTLVDKGLTVVDSVGKEYLAVPTGGKRVSGELDAYLPKKEDALSLARQLTGKPGFDLVRVRDSKGGWQVEWGKSIERTLGAEETLDQRNERLGKQFGYSDKALGAFLGKSVTSPSPARSPEAQKAMQNIGDLLAQVTKTAGEVGPNVLKAMARGLDASGERKIFVLEKALQMYKDGLAVNDPMALAKARDFVRAQGNGPQLKMSFFGLDQLVNWLTNSNKSQIPLPSPKLQRIHDAQQAAKIGVSLTDKLRAMPYSVTTKLYDQFAYLDQNPSRFAKMFAPELVKDFENRTGISEIPIDTDPYKQARLAYGGGGGLVQAAQITIGRISAEAADSGLLDNLKGYMNLVGYDRAIRNIRGKATSAMAESRRLKLQSDALYNDIQIGVEPQSKLGLVTSMRKQARELRRESKEYSAKLAKNEVVPEGYSQASIAIDLNAMKQSLGPQDFQKVEGLADRVYRELEKSWDDLHATGMISSGIHQKGTSLGRGYIPLQRILDVTADVNAKYGSSTMEVRTRKSLRELEGSQLVNIDPLEAALGQIQTAARETQKNLVARSVMNLRALDPGGYGLAIKPAKTDYRLKPDQGTIVVWQNGDKLTYVAPRFIAATLENASPASSAIVGNALLRGTANVFRTGATLANLAFAVPNAIRDVGDFSVLSKAGVRGSLDVGKIAGDWLVSFKQALKEDPQYLDMLRARAGFSTIQRNIADLGSYHKPVTGSLRQGRLIKTIEDFNNLVEESTKLTAFKRSKQLGMSDSEAAWETRNYGGSPDFASRGTMTQAINLVWMFFNANVQGTGRTVSRFAQNKALFTAVLGASAILAMSQLSHNMQYTSPENDGSLEWDHIAQTDKQNYFIAISPGVYQTSTGELRHEYYKVAKPHWAKILYNPIHDAVESFVRGGIDLGQTALDTASNLLPGQFNLKRGRISEGVGSGIISSLNPFFKEPIDQARNMDSYKGIPIEPRGQENLENPEKYGPNTSISARKIARIIYDNSGQESGLAKFPVLGSALTSPDRLEHAWGGFTAGLGGGVQNIADSLQGQDTTHGLPLQGNEAQSRMAVVGPVARRFVGSPLDQIEKNLESEFYQAADSSRVFHGTLMHTLQTDPDNAEKYLLDPRREKYIEAQRAIVSIEKKLGELRNQQKRIYSDTSFSPTDKQEALNSLRKSRMELLQFFHEEIAPTLVTK